jgi:glycosyltransferase involved in cell wall biosynthesis
LLSSSSNRRRPCVLIYRSELLALSETFIAAQARALRQFEPVFVGLRRVDGGLDLPANAQLLTTADHTIDKARRGFYRHTGMSGAFVNRLRSPGPQLLHAHFAVDACEALPLVRALDLPLVVTLHGYDVMMNDAAHAQSARGRVFLRTREALWARAGLFLCVSEAIRARALERGFPAAKLIQHTIGIDLRRYNPRRISGPQPVDDRKIVLFVGRLVEKKGCLHLIHAMAEVQRRLPRAPLVVIGDGPLLPSLKAEAARLNLEASFLGAQPSQQVRHWMGSAHMLAAPSITAANGDAEGLPIVLCEALATGLPVACFRSSGIAELIEHETTGLLAEERDEAALARNIIRLAADEDLCARLARSGRERVERSFDLSAQTAILEQHYRRAISTYRQGEDEDDSNCRCTEAADAVETSSV